MSKSRFNLMVEKTRRRDEARGPMERHPDDCPKCLRRGYHLTWCPVARNPSPSRPTQGELF